METNSNRQLEASVNEPIIEEDAGTQALRGVEEALQPSDDTHGLTQPAGTQPEAREEPTHDLTGTHRDQTDEDETIATES